jgi:hypothetical protein
MFAAFMKIPLDNEHSMFAAFMKIPLDNEHSMFALSGGCLIRGVHIYVCTPLILNP